MRISIIVGLGPLLLATPAFAQQAGHNMPGMTMPAPAPRPASDRPATTTAAAADPHAGHVMPAAPAAAPATAAQGAAPPAASPADAHAGHAMPAVAPGATTAAIPQSPPPPPPLDHAADRVFDPAAMAAVRAQLRREHGGGRFSMVLLNVAEWQPRSGDDGYRWDGEAWYGGDINRFVFKSEGEGLRREGLESAEVQALYSRAITPYFDLQAGIRYDFRPDPSRTYVTVGVEGLAPLFYDVDAAVFLSNKGEVLARLGAWYDQRITQRLILQPRAEINLSAQNVRETGVGSGVSDVEFGLRLRYEIRREFAPYIGVSFERKLGRSADYARLAGEGRGNTSLVVGIRTFF